MTDDAAEAPSIAFDRAAEYYDRTRSLPADVQARVTDVLAEELAGRGLCFEPGVGTGRISLPLHERGVPLVGADISMPMMARLVENAGGHAPFPLMRADLTRLPFTAGAFGAALICHVLHLIPAWRAATTELVRVVRPGGVVVINLGGPPTGMGVEIFRELSRQAGERGLRPGATEPDELDGAMAEVGAPLREVLAVPNTFRFTLTEHFAHLEANRSAATWRLDDDTRVRALAATKAWARDRYGDLDAPRAEESPITWRVYEVG